MNATYTTSRFLRATAGVLILAATLLPLAVRAQTNPNPHYQLMVQAENLLKDGKGDEAVALMQREAAKAPSDRSLQQALGNFLVRTNRYTEALTVFTKILDGIPEFSDQRADIYLRIGETYRRMKATDQAIASLEKARVLAPSNVTVLSTLALVLDAAGRWQEAAELYRETLKLAPNNGVVNNNLGYLMAEHGDQDEAMRLVQKAVEVMPQSDEIRDTLGWVYFKRQMTDAATKIFAEIVSRNPENASFKKHLEMALAAGGKQ